MPHLSYAIGARHQLSHIQHLDVKSTNPDVNYQYFFGMFIENSQIRVFYEGNKNNRTYARREKKQT
jgi:hypothetical protein